MRWKYASVGLSQTSMFDKCSFFAKTDKDFYLLTASVKSTISDVWQGSEYIRLLHLPRWKFSLHPLNVMFDRFLFFCLKKKSKKSLSKLWKMFFYFTTKSLSVL